MKKHDCVVCGEVLANDSLNEINLNRHLTTRHTSLTNKPLECFEVELLEVRIQLKLLKTVVTTYTKHLYSHLRYHI